VNLDKGQGDLAPVALQGDVVLDGWLAGGKGLHEGTGGEHLLVVL